MVLAAEELPVAAHVRGEPPRKHPGRLAVRRLPRDAEQRARHAGDDERPHEHS